MHRTIPEKLSYTTMSQMKTNEASDKQLYSSASESLDILLAMVLLVILLPYWYNFESPSPWSRQGRSS